MSFRYTGKVFALRLIFLTLVASFILLYRADLVDYVILVGAILFFGGFFLLSETSVTREGVVVRRDYFWAIIPVILKIGYRQIHGLQSSTHASGWAGDSGDQWEHESMLGCLFGLFFAHTVAWKSHLIKYEQDGKHKHIEVKLTRDEYIDVWRRMKGPPSP